MVLRMLKYRFDLAVDRIPALSPSSLGTVINKGLQKLFKTSLQTAKISQGFISRLWWSDNHLL